jgi:hypothetical protein
VDRPPYDPAADLYGLGAILLALATGAEPVLAADERDDHERIAGWLARAARDLPSAAELRRLILDLMAEDPARRPALDRVRAARRPGRRRPGTTRTACSMTGSRT